MSTFDYEAFVNVEQDGEFSTKFVPIPTGEFRMQIQGPFGEEKATRIRQTEKGQVILDVVYLVDGIQVCDDGETITAHTGAPTVTVRQSIFLDFTPSGGLAKERGKNVKLGQLLEAIALNGKKWSWNSLIGGMVIGKVTHRIVGDETYADVKSVTAA